MLHQGCYIGNERMLMEREDIKSNFNTRIELESGETIELDVACKRRRYTLNVRLESL